MKLKQGYLGFPPVLLELMYIDWEHVNTFVNAFLFRFYRFVVILQIKFPSILFCLVRWISTGHYIGLQCVFNLRTKLLLVRKQEFSSLSIVKFPIFLLDLLIYTRPWPKDRCIHVCLSLEVSVIYRFLTSGTDKVIDLQEIVESKIDLQEIVESKMTWIRIKFYHTHLYYMVF